MKTVPQKYRPFSTTLHCLRTTRRNLWSNTATQKPNAYPHKTKQMKK